jgi:tetratricopeptide (TPR) repeat protein
VLVIAAIAYFTCGWLGSAWAERSDSGYQIINISAKSVSDECESDDPKITIPGCTAIINADKENARAYFHRGNGYQVSKQFERAHADYADAIRLDPTFPSAYFNRGLLYSTKDLYDLAIKDYDKTLRLNPQHFKAHVARGDAYRLMGQPSKAVEDYDASIRLNPDYEMAHEHRELAVKAIAEEFKDKVAAAGDCSNKDTKIRISACTREIEASPGKSSARAYANRGAAYFTEDRYDLALNDLNKAIGFDPKAYDAFNNRGLVFLAKADYDRAIKDFNRAIHLAPSIYPFYTHRGRAYAGKGEYAKAVKDFDHTLSRDPDYEMAQTERAKAVKALKRN